MDESDWAVHMAAPAYHFSCAKTYLKAGKQKEAAAELIRGETFLKYQNKRIAEAVRRIDQKKYYGRKIIRHRTFQFDH